MGGGGRTFNVLTDQQSGYGGGLIFSDEFPAGLRVLVVDNDPLCLHALEKKLQACLYEVTTCSCAMAALSMLREENCKFDIFLTEVYIPGHMDGLMLLERIAMETNLPVIMMSSDDSKDVVMKGVTEGACDYLIKPIGIQAIQNIWQHVVRKRMNELNLKKLEHSGSIDGCKHHVVTKGVSQGACDSLVKQIMMQLGRKTLDEFRIAKKLKHLRIVDGCSTTGNVGSLKSSKRLDKEESGSSGGLVNNVDNDSLIQPIAIQALRKDHLQLGKKKLDEYRKKLNPLRSIDGCERNIKSSN